MRLAYVALGPPSLTVEKSFAIRCIVVLIFFIERCSVELLWSFEITPSTTEFASADDAHWKNLSMRSRSLL